MKSLNRTLTAALLTGCATSAIAQEDPVFNLIAPDNSFSMGVGYVGGDRQQLGVSDDLNGSQLVFLLAADINTRDDGTGTWFTGYIRGESAYNPDVGNDGKVLELGDIFRSSPVTVGTPSYDFRDPRDAEQGLCGLPHRQPAFVG